MSPPLAAQLPAGWISIQPAAIRSAFSFEAIALFLYFYRDAFAGALRYYFSIVKLDALWFLPDIFALFCIVAFVQRYVITGRSLMAILTLLYMTFALYVGYIFLGYASATASAFKMMAPVFVGFCFCGRDFSRYKWLLVSIHFIFYVTIVGIILSAHVKLPWVGFAYESFGATRTATRLWWANGGERLAGFAADSTMAAFFVFITYVLTSIRRSLAWCLFWAPIGMYAINLTTNKTSMGVMLVYTICMVFIRLLPEREKFPMLRRMAYLSFLSIFVPILLMIFFTGAKIGAISRTLFSLQDRIDNSWQLPFVYMADLMPIGFLTGCGLGCFNYPQQIFSNKISYYVPVDNFYIGTYLMFGPIFVVFMIFVIVAVLKTKDIYKLSATVAMNLFTITVLAYGPASGLLMIGAAFSEVFRNDDDAAVAVPEPVAEDTDGLTPRPT